ncbi:MAG: hypothetical protein DRI88_01830 [Bacteroidetes bacterium]|nr:MAG: hypothetical protein DRI72_07720 [Bacteroidota bacterium]RLD48955.1 MAG: hypothetical protein DRI88_01830 [Bacteroidota bacterium]RLD72562.1 MAG: hypothetical protein DRI87_05560 [Bacteroidota bacterium]RLD88210.1 MAG: hypothetical protein DRJ02_04420 [Bacteroidota bacterium]
MDTKIVKKQQPKYINPYFGGILLGLLLLAAFFIAGRGLSASGAVKLLVVTVVDKVAPAHAEGNAYYSKFIPADGSSPLYNWLIFGAIGTFFGGMLSGAIFGRLKKLRVEHSPKISARTRLIAAGAGGILFGIGSQFGRGCSSGAALSGTASLSFGGLIVMALMFGIGYVFAWFFRKLWI